MNHIDRTEEQTPNAAGMSALSGMEALLSMQTDNETMEAIEMAEVIWNSLIVKGHMIVICAQPNGGKTTIFIECAKDLALKGFDVLYINADASAADMKEYHNHAVKHGYKLIAPDLKIGKSSEDVVEGLTELSKSDANLENTVIILDTLKKFVDVIAKSKAKQLFKIFRSLTGRGATIITLAHTNKYNGLDGKPIYEGTGDIRSDFDELIYLIPIKNEDGTLTVSTDIDKQRAVNLKNITFIIGADRSVTIKNEFINTINLNQVKHNLKRDQPILEFIESQVKFASKSQTELQKLGMDQGYSRAEIRRVLIDYSNPESFHPIFIAIRNRTNGYNYGMRNVNHE
jgi:hypothetical protein